MKVKISKPPAWWRCDIFRDYMHEVYGYINWPTEYTRYEKFLEKLDNCIDWIYDHTINLFLANSEQKVYVRIDPWDTWNMDFALANIILPMLKQLREEKHGAPRVGNEDVPESLWANEAEIAMYKRDGTTDIHFFARWNWVLDEMIYAFEFKLNDKCVWKVCGDIEEQKAVQDRISNGFRLFGKYYEALWD